MAEYVTQIAAGDSGARTQDLVSAINDYREALTISGKLGRVRVTDPAEAEAVADRLAVLRDALGTDDVVIYHVCLHDEGIGMCTPEIR